MASLSATCKWVTQFITKCLAVPLLVFLTNKETLTGYSRFIGIPHHRSNVYRSLPVFALLPMLASCFCWYSTDFVGVPHQQRNAYGLLQIYWYSSPPKQRSPFLTGMCITAFVGVPHQQRNVYLFLRIYWYSGQQRNAYLFCLCWCSSPTKKRFSFSQPC